ncbi:uncharacterized protein N7506_010868 [Penicillium brevicompactum]|uniref:uncharacterized protein n=1 Tax=Penicillium brevicompactum TaxID=5074 RepID=UPI002540AAD6|nr:uncharacterized protein N7506_010868 [Penicillium brevicompactum]KAJ5321738.1 hypothetical protein N7506_010868 [Penicillium brevicompactum]
MYKPAPSRPKKTNIVRSRNGCKGCRERRTKHCERVRPELKFRVVTGPATGTQTDLSDSDAKSTTSQVTSPGDGSHNHEYPAIGGSLVRSLQHTERDVFYSTYWEDHCLPALPPMFRSISELLGFAPLRGAILALSACNISRIQAEQKSSASLMSAGTYRPNLQHQTRSQLYYSSAIKTFTSLTPADYTNNLPVILAILVTFGYIESSMGNFDGFKCHVQGLSAFLVELREGTNDPLIRDLLAAWFQSQFLVWWARAYFSSLDVQRHLPSIHMPTVLAESPGSLHERRAVVLSILCESHHVNTKETLGYWDQSDMLTMTSFQGSQVEFKPLWVVQLEDASTRLDAWIAHLPPSEQPIQDAASPMSPILFHSHDASLNFAYYVAARIMQCTSFLHSLQAYDSQSLHNGCFETENWVRLLLQISQGVDMYTSITMNTYTIGFSGLLLAASLRCQDLSLGLDIEQWLQNLKDMQPTEEGAFPIYQTLAVVKAINQQRMLGRDVFGVSQPVDDGGGSPKFHGYNSQVISSLLMHGRWRDSGDFFTEKMELDI